jgi:hypothetical protein
MPTATKKMVNVNATFTGTNSLGYETGREYQLSITTALNSIFITPHPKHGHKCEPCQYNSIITFLRNWNDIKVH